MRGPVVKIGIPVLNRGDLLTRLLRSIDVEAEVLLIVNRIGEVDAGVEDAVSEWERNLPEGVRVDVRRIEGNLGVAGSWNRIIGHFGGDCWVANSDIAFAPGVLSEAMAQIEGRREIVMQHLWAGACFYVTDLFPKVLGWFDENFYPAYHEDEEMSLRSARLGVARCDFTNSLRERVMHGGSETLKSAPDAQRQFIQAAQHLGGVYLERRWGALPASCDLPPEKHSPFDNAALHPADWTLDREARAHLARRCEEMTGHACPLVFHRACGGLG